MADDRPWLRDVKTEPTEVGPLYDGWASEYDRDLSRWGYEVPQIVARALAANHADAATVLDVGCGTGLVGRALQTAGFVSVTGVDLSVESLNSAKKAGVYDALHEADFQALPSKFADNAFAALVCGGVMSYLPDTAATVAEFCRLVSPGGTVIFTQRQDLWSERSCGAVLGGLAEAGCCEILEVTEPLEYLAGNAVMADIGVILVTLRSL
jgi:predicted TPR repeat methyltransferase